MKDEIKKIQHEVRVIHSNNIPPHPSVKSKVASISEFDVMFETAQYSLSLDFQVLHLIINISAMKKSVISLLGKDPF